MAYFIELQKRTLGGPGDERPILVNIDLVRLIEQRDDYTVLYGSQFSGGEEQIAVRESAAEVLAQIPKNMKDYID